MARIHIKPHNYREYAAAFHDDECVECQESINEGDPIGFIDEISSTCGDPGRYGPLCHDCVASLATKMEVKIE